MKMKNPLKFITCTLALTLASAASDGSIIISEIVDATLPGGLPKFVELTNMGAAPIDLSDYRIGVYSNGSTALSNQTVLSGSIAPLDSFVISYEAGDAPGSGSFFTVFGFDPDNNSPAAAINGDDGIGLFQGVISGTEILVDRYGVSGVDGSGQSWDYTDGFAVRKLSVAIGNATFTDSEWTFGGPNSLETGDDTTELSLILATVSPGVHVPEPTSLSLLFIALSSLFVYRRNA